MWLLFFFFLLGIQMFDIETTRVANPEVEGLLGVGLSVQIKIYNIDPTRL